MSKNKTKNEVNETFAAKKEPITLTREERWSAAYDKVIAILKDCHAYKSGEGLLPIEAMEEIDGRPFRDIIISAVQKWIAVDTGYTEREAYYINEGNARALATLDKDEIRFAIYNFLEVASYGRELATDILRKFYRRGDKALAESVLRAAQCAVGMKED